MFAKIESNRKESLALADKWDALLPKLVSGEVPIVSNWRENER